jgi:hypothetical protein
VSALGWEEEHPDHGADGEWLPAGLADADHHSSLSLGLLAMAPLFLAYELGLAADPGLLRGQSEQALFRVLSLAPDAETWLRRGALAALVLVALVSCFRRRVALAPSLSRVVLEGLAGAVVLGPALALGTRLLGVELAVEPMRTAPTLAEAGRVLGGAAFEELLFRVLVYGALYVLARRLLLLLRAPERLAGLAGDLFAVGGSALGFAAVHLESWTAWISTAGEPYDAGVFTWRLLAGVLLALLFRWRGPGVAAWSHGLFNLALLIGADPEVFL